MSTFPKVSVLLAAYNSGKTIRESIQSVLSQRYPSLQLIVCDDGTRDFDQKNLENFIREQFPLAWVKVIHQPENVGTVRNLNAGLRQADGEWIMLMAADDCFMTERAVERLMIQVCGSGREWAIAQTALCNEELVPSGLSIPTSEMVVDIAAGNIGTLYLRLCTGCCLPATGSVYKADLLARLGGFDETYRLTEDWPLFLKLVRQGLMPAISGEELVLHRFGGVSRKNPGKNYAYQHDLITVLRKEVAPHIGLLDREGQKTVCRLICEKELGFEFRFSGKTKTEKLVWIMRHPLFMLKKLLGKREKIC